MFMPTSFSKLTASDPNAPKRGLSAYMFFANEQRESVRKAVKFGTQSSRSSGQTGKVLGNRWKALSEEGEHYEKKAVADKRRYEDEKAKYITYVLTFMVSDEPTIETLTGRGWCRP